MTYHIGGVEMEGEKPVNVIELVFGRKVTDGGKARIAARRRLIFPQEGVCDLSMREADTAPCEMNPA